MAQSPEAEELHNARMSRQALLVGKGVEDLRVFVVGVGGIGSNATHLLVSMGVHNITVLDPDMVEEENLFPAWFHPEHVGNLKIDAVQSQANWYGVEIDTINCMIDDLELGDEQEFDIVIVGTDDIESRAQAWKKLNDHTSWWIDARMGGMGADMFCFHTGDPDAVRSYTTEQLEPFASTLLCGEKATAYNTKGAIMMMLGWNIRDITMDGFYPFYFMSVIGERNSLISSPKPPIIGE